MPTTETGGLDRGFQPAIDYFTQKVNLPTRTWRDLHQGQHARAFVVAGAMKEDLLTDLRAAVDGAVLMGESYDTFKRRFKDIVARHGWVHNGSANWRSRVIWQTNVRTAYAAGRYQQMTDPAVLAHMPWWHYDHTTITNPREQHKAWDGLVLRHDDAFWKTNYPPNGWGCNCRVRPLSDRQMRKLKPDGPDTAPENAAAEVAEEWRYNVGEAAWGKPLGDKAMAEWSTRRADAWETMGPINDPISLRRPEKIPLDAPLALGKKTADGDALRAAVVEAIGAEEVIVPLVANTGFRYDVHLSADTIARHVDPHRGQSLPLLLATLRKPWEVWQSFERHKGTGRVVLRTRFIRAFDVAKTPGQLVVVEATAGRLEGWTMVPTKLAYLAKQRYGALVYARED